MATRIGKELVDSDVKHSKCDQVKQKTSEWLSNFAPLFDTIVYHLILAISNVKI
jgi:hypothetical protein